MNMKGLAKILRAVVMTMAAGQAMAATDRVDVKVTGDIVPPACVPAVSGGAVFDYGGIKAASLAKDDYTVLDRKSLDFSVKCDSPTKIAFKATDGRPGTNVVPLNKVLLTVAATANTPLYGLGAEGGKLIGAYRLMVSSVKIDNAKNAKGLISHDNGNTWGTSLYMWLNPVANTLSSLGDASSSLKCKQL